MTVPLPYPWPMCECSRPSKKTLKWMSCVTVHVGVEESSLLDDHEFQIIHYIQICSSSLALHISLWVKKFWNPTYIVWKINCMSFAYSFLWLLFSFELKAYKKKITDQADKDTCCWWSVHLYTCHILNFWKTTGPISTNPEHHWG